MKLFDLIDRWHQRKVLLRLIKKREREIEYNRGLLRWVPDIEPDKARQEGLIKYVLKDEQKQLDEIKLYKTKLRQLL